MSISKMKDQNYHHGDLRNTLISAGVELLKQDGMEKLSLRKLAREAGVSHNAPYMHFKDKEGLLAAIAQEGFNLLADRLRQAINQDYETWYEKFRCGCQAYIDFVLEYTGHAQVMFRYYDPEKYVEQAQASMAAIRLLENILEEGQTTGQIVAGDSLYQASIVWAFLHGIANILAAGKMPFHVSDHQTTESLVDDFLQQFYVGLQIRPTSAP